MDEATFWKRCMFPRKKAWGEYLGDSRVRYHFVCGHTTVKTMVNDFTARLMGRWHSMEKGGSTGQCRRCCKK